MPTAPRSSTKAHSAAIRLTTSSAVKIGGIPRPSDVRTSRILVIFSGSRAHRLSSVIPDIDIWRAASLMLKRYGDNAHKESGARADELAAEGDPDGAAIWRLIIDAVEQLANTTPPAGSINRT